jgi:phosphate transport system permease protein
MAASSSALSNATIDSPAQRRSTRDARADGLFRWIVASAGLFVLLALLGAALSMLWGGREAFSTFGFGFLTSTDWDAVNHKFGALVPIYGTWSPR